MIRYLAAGIKHAFGLHRPGRRLPVRPDDILLASYPRSGNTWLRFLIANLLHPDQVVDFGNLHRFIVDPDVTVKRDIDRAPWPRIVKTHDSFDPRYRRVIYVVRDPRGVALSQYNHLRELQTIADDVPIEDFIEQFLTGGLNRHLGSWGESVGSWLATRSGYPGFLLVRYEDLLAATVRELTKVADFMGRPADPERISQAIARTSADKVWAGEKKQGQSYLPIQPEKSRWRTELPKPQVARIEAAWGDIMTCLGYDLITEDAGGPLKHSLIKLLAAGTEGSTGEREEVFSSDITGIPGSMAQRSTMH